jgi:hypothetical protein
MLSVVLLTITLVTLAPHARSFAAADTTTVSQRFPIDLDVFVPCAAGGAGEEVLLSGTLHDLFSITANSAGGFRVKQLDNPQGISGTGLTTGDKYQATGMTTSIFTVKTGSTDTYVNRFLIRGQGTDNDFLVRETFHVTVNANGELTAYVDNFSIECK